MSFKIHFLMQYPYDINNTIFWSFKEDDMRTGSNFPISFSHVTNIY